MDQAMVELEGCLQASYARTSKRASWNIILPTWVQQNLLNYKWKVLQNFLDNFFILRVPGQICTTSKLKSGSENMPLDIPKRTSYEDYPNQVIEFHPSFLKIIFSDSLENIISYTSQIKSVMVQPRFDRWKNTWLYLRQKSEKSHVHWSRAPWCYELLPTRA